MSILNSRFNDAEILEDGSAFANTLLKETFERVPLDERQSEIVSLLQEGLSLADILGITKEQLDALAAQAGLFIQAGELDKARDLLLKLNELEPTDERAYYLLGTVFQIRGDLERAAFFYLRFLALDATSPDGYLRLGECLMAAGEHKEAEGALQMALDFARDGKGRAGCADDAERLLDRLGAMRPNA